jgi:predicted amidohydrolase
MSMVADMLSIGVAQVPPSADLQANLEMALSYLQRAADQGVDLICFPETHLSGYRVGILPADAPCSEGALRDAAQKLSERCAVLGIGAVVGTETPNAAGKPYNSALVIGDDGARLAVHHKSRLTPLDAAGYTSGHGPTSFTFRGIPMGVVICFEGFRFPETTRALASNGARVVFHPQFNHILPGMEWKLPVHEALLVTRAAENTIYFVSANMAHPCNNCRSLVIAPDGLIQAAAPLGEETLLVTRIEPSRATHAFLHDDAETRKKALAES